jgi:hypothetical protein
MTLSESRLKRRYEALLFRNEIPFCFDDVAEPFETWQLNPVTRTTAESAAAYHRNYRIKQKSGNLSLTGVPDGNVQPT